MSRRHRHQQPAQQQPGRKAQEREARVLAARQRMRFPTFAALALMVMDKWQKTPEIQEDIAGLTANERRYYKMQIAKCNKRVLTVVRLLHDKAVWPTSPTGTFWQDAISRNDTLLHCICIDTPSMPDTCRYMDVHAILTYLIYVALHEWETMELRSGREDSLANLNAVDDMITALQQFSDHIIPADSQFITPLNDVYCYTRNYLHSGAPVPFYPGLPVRECAMLAA